jgi:surface antigen
LAAVALGTLAGAYVGGEVGKSLDAADKAYMQRTTQATLENNRTGQTATWSNPDSGHSGTVTPTETYQTAENTPCREFESTVRIDGEEQTAVGRACRQPDGTWRVVE